MKPNLNFLPEENAEQIREMAVISQVAHMYYDLDMLQPEIAEKLFFSRSKVSRMLKRARELGIVEIKVKRILDRAPNIEEKLKKIFPLKEAIVVTSYEGNNEDMLNAVTNFAALYVSSLLKGNCVFGISRGNTIIQVARKLTRVNNCRLDVVQLMGASAHTNTSIESRELVNTVSSIYGGNCYYLNTPLYVDDLYAKEVLLQDPSIQETFKMMKYCDIVLTGIGAFDMVDGSANWFGYLTRRHLDELQQKAAVGSICGQFYDINGAHISCEWNKKCIGMPFEYINRSNTTIGVAAGEGKVLPILGALRGRLIDVVITDAQTALSVIEQQEKLS